MKTTVDKQSLKDWIDQLEDEAYLVTLESIRKNATEGDFWDELSDETKKAIKKGKKQLDEGKGIPNDKVMQEVKERFFS